MKKTLAFILFLMILSPLSAQDKITFEAPGSVPVYEIAEFTIRISEPPEINPFTGIEIKGIFRLGSKEITITGFCDSHDGSLYRLRFSPGLPDEKYNYVITIRGGGLDRQFPGELTSTSPVGSGPVITNPLHPKHFMYAGTGRPFYHLGYTAYNLLDIANDDNQVEQTIQYCREHGFNKIRFLLTGYPREFDNRTSDDEDYGVPEDPWKAPNYGALPGRVNPLPAWQGEPHKYDFARFNVSHWQRIDRAVTLMRENGIIATCIMIIEKQNLPREIGVLTENEYRLYSYAIARLAAFDNVWWDLGNEHNEVRTPEWGNAMGNFVKDNDPYDRLASAHGHAAFYYNDSPWADFIITQQYGDMDSCHNWTLRFSKVEKPFINEEYGYEGRTDAPSGHGMNAKWVRRCHWAIAMAGGYATYGDWSDGTSYFYMGFPGPGKAALQLKHLKAFFESLPFTMLKSSDNLVTKGYCLSKQPDIYVVYLPEGGSSEIDLSGAGKKRQFGRWFDPETGQWSEILKMERGKNLIQAPEGEDRALLIRNSRRGFKK